MQPTRTVVLGSTGFTGRLVAAALARGPRPFLLTARDPGKLARLAAETGGAETLPLDVTDPGAVRLALRPGDVVVNCAGPFTELGEAVVGAAVDAGAHYLDTTGEQRFMWSVLQRYGEPASRAGVAVVNAMAFEYALGDCAAPLAAEGLARPLLSVDVTYAWRGVESGTSRGTRRSALRILGRRGYAYLRGRWVLEAPASRRREVRLPEGRTRSAVSFPAGEVLTIPRHLEVEQVRGWMVVQRRLAKLLPPVAPVLPPLIRAATPLLDRWLTGAPDGPGDAKRDESEFVVQVEAVGADGGTRGVRVSGRDPYGLTAEIAVLAAERLHGRVGERTPAGVLAPAQVLDPRPFLSALAPHGTVLDETQETPA